MVSKSLKLRFGVCHEKAKHLFSLNGKSAYIANGAEISRIDGFVKIAKIERKVQAPR